MTKSTDELKERMKNSCGWCGRYPPCNASARPARALNAPPAPAHPPEQTIAQGGHDPGNDRGRAAGTGTGVAAQTAAA